MVVALGPANVDNHQIICFGGSTFLGKWDKCFYLQNFEWSDISRQNSVVLLAVHQNLRNEMLFKNILFYGCLIRDDEIWMDLFKVIEEYPLKEQN